MCLIVGPSLGMIITMALDNQRLESVTRSCSMYHNSSLDEWWEHNAWRYPNITKEEFSGFPFPNGLERHEVRVVAANASDISVGDVMVLKTDTHPPIVAHRVIRKWDENWSYVAARYPLAVRVEFEVFVNATLFETVGDNTFDQMSYERRVESWQVVGKVVEREWWWRILGTFRNGGCG